MEAGKCVTEEQEPMMACEPAVAYGAAAVKSDFDCEWERSMTVEEFHDYCVKRIQEIFA